jgi:hypothetical protein
LPQAGLVLSVRDLAETAGLEPRLQARLEPIKPVLGKPEEYRGARHGGLGGGTLGGIGAGGQRQAEPTAVT